MTVARQLTAQDSGWWVVSEQDRIWLPGGALPCGSAEQWQLEGQLAYGIGEWQGMTVWLLCQASPQDMVSVRQLIDADRGLFQLAGRGVQLAGFFQAHRYCGACGHPMQASQYEWARLCPQCQQRYYPQIAPCIIVAIRRDDHILLARHNRHRNGIYTVLAGFVEVGETLEQAAAREIFEESQLQIKNLRYVASQPWPFPHSLMMAFLADYAAGELCHDPKELQEAGWYRYDRLPQLPPAGTVARLLIEDTVALCRAQHE